MFHASGSAIIGVVNANFAPELTQKLDTLPERPGVYIYRSSDRTVIYVGKAVVLRNRVRSYFQANRDPKTRRLVSEIADLEWIVTDTELEALILENELIKRHRPRFNVRLKDDKTYPYIKLHWNEDFPKVTIVRRMERDGGRYYGPFTSAYAVRQTLDVLRRVFPYLDCTARSPAATPSPVSTITSSAAPGRASARWTARVTDRSSPVWARFWRGTARQCWRS